MSEAKTTERKSGFVAQAALASAMLVAPALATPAGAGEFFDDWANSQYNYCDAKKLAKAWKLDIAEAKERIGFKVRNNFTAVVDEATENVKARCSFDDTKITVDEAVAIAKYWSMSVEKAKVEIGKKVSRRGGSERFVRANVLAAANNS